MGTKGGERVLELGSWRGGTEEGKGPGAGQAKEGLQSRSALSQTERVGEGNHGMYRPLHNKNNGLEKSISNRPSGPDMGSPPLASE